MHDVTLVVFTIGVMLFAAGFVHMIARRFDLPPLVGYIVLGFLLRWLDGHFHFLGPSMTASLATMGELGIAVLLFKVGLETHLEGLLGQLSQATIIWVGNVVASAGGAYLVARYAIGLELVPSLFVSAALSATSVGISVGAWRDAGVLQTERGELLIDVAELDDISGVIAVAVLFAVAPLLREGAGGDVSGVVLSTLGWLLVKAIAFGAFCYLFSRYGVHRLTQATMSMARGPELTEIILAVGFVIAAVAGWLGFSVAIGALFAGVVFSRDPDAVKDEGSFHLLYDLFAPFFFIGIGIQLDPAALVSGMKIGLPLLLIGVAGKVVGTWLPALPALGHGGALLLGVSLVPRAEIALIIMRQGEVLGTWAVPPFLYAAMVVMSAATCLFTPFAVKGLLGMSSIEHDEERPEPRR